VEALGRVLAAARSELGGIIRRDLAANLEAEALDDLSELIVSRGAGVPAREVAVALRTSERIVRRAPGRRHRCGARAAGERQRERPRP
jgi:hypothetical protein